MSACEYCSRTECFSGQYCPTHYAVAVTCAGGYFCPDLLTKLPCPKGSYCRKGSAEPTTCYFLNSCPALSSCPLDLSWALLMAVTLVLWYGGYRMLFDFRDAERLKRMDRRKATKRAIELTMRNKEILRMGSAIKMNANGGEVAMLRKARNLNLGFRTLSVDIHDGKKSKRIIDNVSGDIRAGRLTAIMGPSGAGKSSFLHVIGGRLRKLGESQTRVDISGSVLINGERRSVRPTPNPKPEPRDSLLSLASLALSFALALLAHRCTATVVSLASCRRTTSFTTSSRTCASAAAAATPPPPPPAPPLPSLSIRSCA
jgi:hypothetical protein